MTVREKMKGLSLPRDEGSFNFRLKLSLTCGIIVLFILLAATVLNYRDAARRIGENKKRMAQQELAHIKIEAAGLLRGRTRGPAPHFEELSRVPFLVYASIRDRKGNPVRSFDRHWKDIKIKKKIPLEQYNGAGLTAQKGSSLDNTKITISMQTNLNGDKIALYSAPVYSKGVLLGSVIIGQSVSDTPAYISGILPTAAPLLLAAFILTMIAAFLAANHLMKPIQALINTIKHVRTGDLTARVPLIPNNEIGSITRHFNGMMDLIEGRTAEIARRADTYRTYVPESMVRHVEKGKDPSLYVPTEKVCAILNCRISNLPAVYAFLRPGEGAKYLKSFFGLVHGEIFRYRGEKPVHSGDTIISEFTNPDDALEAALSIQSALSEWSSPDKQILEKGIELFSVIDRGTVISGNIKPGDKIEYIMLGDAVENSSRIISIGKLYHSPIIITARAKENLKKIYAFRFIDRVLFDESEGPRELFEVFDYETPERIDIKLAMVSDLENAFSCYTEGDFTSAREIYNTLREKYFRDPLLDFYIERCGLLQKKVECGHMSTSEWKGIFNPGKIFSEAEGY